ncbi:Hypothetical protein NTJ_15449 [Nesidiocoris tenuis]|uniref:Uncharacterized protein n=1 Tax=Nesidiocoris tenuis TaxID=355587 RepID=A0ABN7BH65_9HEMI|nr:Hypothetical protein NTJ_15449 [Nesidiocoris tenuis]
MSVNVRRSQSLRSESRSRSRLSEAGVTGARKGGTGSYSGNDSDNSRRSDRTGDRRPHRSVSFNRDVHIKRFANRLADRQLSRIDESPNEDEMRMRGRDLSSRGRGDGNEDDVRFIERGSSANPTRATEFSSTTDSGPSVRNIDSGNAKEGLAQKIKAFFKRSNKKATDGSKATNTKDESADKPYQSYSKFEDDYSTRRRGSAPAPPKNWFRSLDRSKSVSKSDIADSGRLARSDKNLRYFGESDMDRATYSTLRNNRRRYLDDTSQDDTTDADVPNRYGSLVYLHAAAVRDIPSRIEGSSTVRRKTKKNLSRSFSMSGPWTPQHKPKLVSTSQPVNYNPSATRETGTFSRSRSRPTSFSSRDVIDGNSSSSTYLASPTSTLSGVRGRNKLPELVFTGPPLDHTLRRNEWRGRI